MMTGRSLWVQLSLATQLLAGPFHDKPIAANDPRIINWGVAATVVRGPVEISAANGTLVGFGDASDATGPADATEDDPLSVVSLGDGGSATVRFDPPFSNLPGPDFVVFENSHMGGFLELAHVEVSSDGIHFFRFPSVSLTQTKAQIDTFDVLDPTEVHNLAGKHRAGLGTAFDLEELLEYEPAIDLQRITHVRVIDVVGSINPAHASRDSEGRIINDPYPTPFFTGGFDLDAIGAFSATPTDFQSWLEITGERSPLQYATGGFLQLQLDDNLQTLSFIRRNYRHDATVRVEASDDLESWVEVAAGSGGGTMNSTMRDATIHSNNTLLEHIQITLPRSHPTRFFRLAVEIPPP